MIRWWISWVDSFFKLVKIIFVHSISIVMSLPFIANIFVKTGAVQWHSATLKFTQPSYFVVYFEVQLGLPSCYHVNSFKRIELEWKIMCMNSSGLVQLASKNFYASRSFCVRLILFYCNVCAFILNSMLGNEFVVFLSNISIQ